MTWTTNMTEMQNIARSDPDWMKKVFIPVYRRLLDVVRKPLTAKRAIRSAEQMIRDEAWPDAYSDQVPAEMKRSFSDIFIAVNNKKFDTEVQKFEKADSVYKDWARVNT